MKEDISLLISVSSCRDWKPQFGASLCGIVQHLSTERLGGRLSRIEMSTKFQASCLSEAREEALIYAQKEGFSHWFSLDDDMAFPANVVDRLLKHDLSVVTANYRRKMATVTSICLDTDGQFVDSTGRTGLQEIGWMGGGCNLFKIKDISVVEPPRFSVLFVKERNRYMSEDYYFSMKLREKGIKLYCDHDVSNEIQHIGDVAYTFPKELK